MKKTFTRTIIICIVFNLITVGFTLAQDIIEEENQEILKTQAKEESIAKREAEIAAKLAEKVAEEAAKEAEVARKQMKAAEKQMKDAEKQMQESEKKMKDAVLQNMDIELKMNDLMVDLRVPKVNLPHLPHFRQSGSGGGVLVIPADQMKVENLAVVTEDMSVMSRIFSQKLDQSNVLTARGRLVGALNPYFGRGNSKTEAIFLEGYGALFLMKVNMLLSAPPEAQQKKEIKEDTDPVWSQMRREMYEPEKVGRSRTNDRTEEKYDAEKVESLKTNLIKTLKHATNIRALKSDQLVILTVIGDGSRSASTITRSYSYIYNSRSTGRRRMVQTAPGNGTASLQPTVLTICAKKSDIDAFAKGELDYDQFRKRTGIFKSYAKAGQQASPGIEVHQVAHEVHDAF